MFQVRQNSLGSPIRGHQPTQDGGVYSQFPQADRVGQAVHPYRDGRHQICLRSHRKTIPRPHHQQELKHHRRLRSTPHSESSSGLTLQPE